MINWIINKIKQDRESQRIRQAKYAKHLIDAENKKNEERARLINIKRKEKKQEFIELRLITINNTRYIRSYMNTLGSVLASSTGKNAAETRKKRDGARKKLEWLKCKLSEEESMTIYYDSLIKRIS